MPNDLYRYVNLNTSTDETFVTSDNREFTVLEYIDNPYRLILYKNSAELNRVDKSQYIEKVGEIYGVFRDSTSMTDITVLIEYSGDIDFNYVSIPKFNRYYYVNDIRLVRHNLYEIDLSVDVLMSWKSALLKLYAYVDRSESHFNPYIIDKKFTFEQGVDVEDIEISVGQYNLFDKMSPSDNDAIYVLNGYSLSVEL